MANKTYAKALICVIGTHDRTDLFNGLLVLIQRRAKIVKRINVTRRTDNMLVLYTICNISFFFN